VDAYAGQIVTTNPGEVHDGRPLGAPSRCWCTVYVEPATLSAMGPPHHADIAIARPVLVDAELARATRRLLHTLRAWRQGEVEALACEESLVLACGLLLQRHTTRRPVERPAAVPLASVRDRLADDLLAPPSLAELAAQAGLSRFQLLRRFAALHGCTPHAFVMQQRAERARSLIRQGGSLAEAAAASGFADQSHMTRIFARQFGFTPGAWQQATRRLQ
jgi:AraC-like DNA-binding protein